MGEVERVGVGVAGVAVVVNVIALRRSGEGAPRRLMMNMKANVTRTRAREDMAFTPNSQAFL